ncbi:hypothetical protein BGX33_002471 [Mortierella sp. NVP41]|nr:hypothetical protein BGX33_002471 [Mortierella sp. NVP41]
MTTSTNFSSTRTHGISLPELLTPIGSYLDPPDLLSCVQVCRLWYQFLIPTLWRTIDDRLYSWPRIIPYLTMYGGRHSSNNTDGDGRGWLRKIYSKYGHHIRHLSSKWIATIIAASTSGTCIHLRSLNVFNSTRTDRNTPILQPGYNYDSQREPPPYPNLISPLLDGFLALNPNIHHFNDLSNQQWITVQRCWLLVLQNPALESLGLGKMFEVFTQSISTQFLFRILSTLPNLTRLNNDIVDLNLQEFWRLFPAIRHYSSNVYFPNDRTRADNKLRLDTNFTQPLTLHLSDTIRTRTLWDLLRSLPNLEQLTLGCLDRPPNYPPAQDTPTIIGRTPSRLRGLHFTRGTTYYSERFLDTALCQEVLPWLPHLTELSVEILTQAIAVVLVRDCQQLESIKLSSKRRDPSEALVTLLHGCRHLKYLDALCQMVDAGQLLKKPIVCRGLEVFRCQVVGLGRLFATEEAAYETCLRFLIEKGGSSTIKAKDIQDQQIREILPFLQTADEIKIMRDVIDTHERCQEQHRQFCDQLGQLTKLRILEVGASNKDGKRIYDSCPRTYLVNGRLYYEGYGG